MGRKLRILQFPLASVGSSSSSSSPSANRGSSALVNPVLSQWGLLIGQMDLLVEIMARSGPTKLTPLIELHGIFDQPDTEWSNADIVAAAKDIIGDFVDYLPLVGSFFWRDDGEVAPVDPSRVEEEIQRELEILYGLKERWLTGPEVTTYAPEISPDEPEPREVDAPFALKEQPYIPGGKAEELKGLGWVYDSVKHPSLRSPASQFSRVSIS
ncbi:hypothetical protein VTO42DRAFT_7599 [Malbranchea cinnamomea]